MYIFVYGTLKKGDTNHFRMKDSEFVSRTKTADKYLMLDLGSFPGVIKQETAPGIPASWIQGEVYDISDKTLSELDSYEGEWYFREEVQLENGAFALMYFLRAIPPVKYHIVTDGNWT
jgi:gamma-glutamylcyclotransferase (GGCT)/AIG2-like uncharacterized protein YtfP